MKKILILSVVLTALIAGCADNKEIVEEQQTGKERTITLTASMPDEGSETAPATGAEPRIALTPDGKNIKLTWQAGDQLQLCFVQGDTKVKQTVTVSNISGDGKRATFDINIPAEITTGTFDLYGVYGGGGLSDTDPTIAILPTGLSLAGDLTGVQDQKHVMLKFSQTGIDVNNPSISVTFSHLGSLFSVRLKNTSASSWDGISKIKIIADTGQWLYGDENGGVQYNLVSGTFVSGPVNSNYMAFNLSSPINLPAGEEKQFWGWYPPVSDVPSLRLEVLNSSDQILAQSSNSRPSRDASSGKSYYFYAVWDGTLLKFADDAFSPRSMMEDLSVTGDIMHAAEGTDFIGIVYSKSGSVYYNAAKFDGTWTGETLLGEGTEARIAIDGGNHPHVVYTSGGQIIYRTTSDGTNWNTENITSNYGGTCSSPDISVDAEGHADISYTDSNGNGDGYRDIMYAENSSGTFVKTLIFNGFFDDYGGSSGYGEYYKKKSYIAIDQSGGPFVVTHRQTINKAPGWIDNNYYVVVKSSSASGGTSGGTGGTYKTDPNDTYDIAFNGTDVVALFKDNNVNKTAVLQTSGTTINFTNSSDIATTGVTPTSLSVNASHTVVSGYVGSTLFTKYDAYENTYSGITIKSGTKPAVVNVYGIFYAVYTDNAGSVKIVRVKTSRPPIYLHQI